MHDFHYFLYLGCLFTHMNIIIQVSQHSFNFYFNLSNTMLTSAFNILVIIYMCIIAWNFRFL